jgi:membrane associated rhomboid family serine protease
MQNEPSLRLEEGRRLLDAGDHDAAIRILGQLTGHPDADLAGDAWLLIGTARYRLDDEHGALSAWQQTANRGGRSAWLGWRSVAEQLVRDGDLDQAITAYREADRRAPADERGAIANRIAWLLKETGHDFAARRQFNRARGAYASFVPVVTYALLAINVGVFALDWLLAGIATGGLMSGGGPLVDAGLVWGRAVAAGEWWRIFTSAFLHLGIMHLVFNMLALYIFGPILEQLYGRLEYLVLYLLCAVGGSVLTILVVPDQRAAGASGAIFGLFGLAFVASRRHHLLLAGQARTLFARVGTLLAINLVITFLIPFISWTGHLGGLAVGAAIGFALAPRVTAATLGGIWRAPSGERLQRDMPLLVRAAIYLGIAALLYVGALAAVGQFG